MEPLATGDPLQIGIYRLRARLGAGGMGQVFLGFSPAGRPVAVKVIHRHLAADPAFRARFRREVAAAQAVSGAYTAPVVAADPDADPPWLATMFVVGPSLAEAVAAAGPLPTGPAWRLAVGLAEALGEIHGRGLVHRDLKPANVLLAIDGPRVIDFGISWALESTTMTGTGLVVGTPSFMSPEQAGGGRVGPSSDVFSLGCLIVFAAAGTGPFGDGPVLSLLYRVVHGEPMLDAVPGRLRDLAAACLAKDPTQRPALPQLMEALTADAPPQAASLAGYWPETVAALIRSHQGRLGAELVRAGGRDEERAPAAEPRPAGDLTDGTMPSAVVAAQRRPATEVADPPHQDQPPARQDQPVAPPAQKNEPAAPPPQKDRPAAPPAQKNEPAAPPPRQDQPAAPMPAAAPVPVAVPGGSRVPAGVARDTGLAGRPPEAGRPPATDQPPPAERTGPGLTRRRVLAGTAAAVGLAAVGYELGREYLTRRGTEIWSSSAEGSAYYDPMIANGVVYVPGNTSGASGGPLYALRAVDGATKWSSSVGGGVYTGPTIAGSIVYFGGNDNRLHALRTADGTQIWSSAIGGGVLTGPTVAGSIVYFGGNDNRLHALRAADGAQIWSSRMGGGLTTDPVVVDGAVYYGGNDNKLHALHAGSGAQIWTTASTDGSAPDPALARGLIYVGGYNYRLYALHAADAKPIWSTGIGAGVYTGPAVVGGVIYFGGYNYRLYALDAASGKQIWDTRTGGGILTGPAVSRGVVYFGGYDYRLYALRAADGTQIWDAQIGGGILTGPAVAGNVVYVGGKDNKVYALRA